MTAQIIRGTEVNRPEPERVTSSVLDHAAAAGNLTTISHFGLRNNAGMWPSYNCLDLFTPGEVCSTSEAVAYKTFETATWQTAFDFSVYGGVQCSAVGLDTADQKREVSRVFERGEGRGVEQALLYTRLAEQEAPEAGEDGPLWDEPVDVTPSATVPLHVALALLEGHAAANYNGLPTIHMPRAAATVLSASGLIVWNGDLAFTKNGSRVAIGGGYDDPAMLTSGTWTMYATGEVYVERSDTLEFQSYVTPGDGSGTGEDENGLADNTVIALVERLYRVAIDCYAAKVTGKVF